MTPTSRPAYRVVSGALGALLLGAALAVGARPTGPLPPLGLLLDPHHGAWALARTAEHPSAHEVRIPTLSAPVDVRYDDRGVPHIFATTLLDAMRAQGYVVARDRLFQLELQTRAAAGTLTELVGARALEVDRTTRRNGLPWGARRKFEAAQRDADAMASLEAYAEGVNAYLDQLKPADLPLEYRLLGRQPQRWHAEHTMLLLVRMGLTLAWSDFELTRAPLEARIGRAAVDALFPQDAWMQEPIQPTTRAGTPRRTAVIPPPRPDPAAARIARTARALAPQLAALRVEHDGVLGSNNWAVAPARSATGFALLANDPHLELSLPSIWYEVHLVVPDTLDSYGVTFPGAPGLILGMNRHIAWGATNVGADVADYYVEVVDDPAAPTQYRLDGTWEPLVIAAAAYRDPAGRVLAQDTLRYTHRGPLLSAGEDWVSRRWLVLEPSADLAGFLTASRATSVEHYFAAMTDHWSPAQNFIVADRAGSIGIRSTGRYPVRPDGARGDRFFDGSTRASDWTGYITPSGAPQSINPAQGFLASANQQPAHPADLPAYLGSDWPAPWRALHINALLRRNDRVTVDAMRAYQTDPGNARADTLVPRLLRASRAVMAAGAGDSALARAVALLDEWDRRFTPDNTRAALFEAILRDLGRLLWDELAVDPADGDASTVPTRFLALPPEHVLVALLDDPGSIWWDRAATPQRESRDSIVATAMRTGLAALEADRGPMEDGGWRWEGIRVANIWHPLRIPALSALGLPVQGGRESLNPSSGNGVHGASWRLVAELGPEVVGFGIYPGGQSANPVSPFYRDRLERWRTGGLDSLRTPATPSALTAPHHRASLTLLPRPR